MKDQQSTHIPFFTVVICTYNRAPLIRRALDSLQEQTCTDWECIIIDDESTDDTAQVVTTYTGQNIHYIQHAHCGCAGSKNAGMELAKGKYITFLDSDDEYEPEHLALRMKVLQNEPEIDLLYSTVKVIGDPFVPDKNDPEKMIAIADCVVGGTFVIKSAALKSADRFRDIYSDDSLFLERLMASGRSTKKISNATYIYHRDSPDSMCDHVDEI